MPPVGNFGAISTRPGRSHGPEVPDVHGMHGNVNGCLCRIRVKARGARGVCAGWQRRTEVRRDRKAVRHCAGDALSWAKAPGSRRSDRGSGATPVGRRVGQSARPR